MIDLKLMMDICAMRPTADKSIEQVLMTEESMRQQGMRFLQMIPSESSVASLGDDDHISIVLGNTVNADITVFETDERVIANLRKVARHYSLKHTVQKHDIAYMLPGKYNAKFDVCLSNPPYSSKNHGFGIKVWLSRSVQLLKPFGLGLLVIPIQERFGWSLANMIDIQRYLADLGCVVIDIDKDAHAYYAANDVGLMSSNIWYRLVRAPGSECLIGDVTDRDSIYR